jgi:hypothetical protein
MKILEFRLKHPTNEDADTVDESSEQPTPCVYPPGWSTEGTILDNGNIVGGEFAFNGIAKLYDSANNKIKTIYRWQPPVNSQCAENQFEPLLGENPTARSIVISIDRRFVVGVLKLDDGSHEIHWCKNVKRRFCRELRIVT